MLVVPLQQKLQTDFELHIKKVEEQCTTSAPSVSSFEHGMDATLTAQAAGLVTDRIDEVLKVLSYFDRLFTK